MWDPWSSCSTSCGVGTRTRQQNSCSGPLYAGMPCQGSGLETENCQSKGHKIMILIVTHCEEFFLTCHDLMFSVEGAWASWEPWNNCSTTCGQGTQSRARNFTGGLPCTGNATDTQTCQSKLLALLLIISLA